MIPPYYLLLHISEYLVTASCLINSGLPNSMHLVGTMPSADSCTAVRSPLGVLSPSRDTTQVSRGNSDRLQRATVESTLRVLGGYGLCSYRPARPTLTPCIRFLSIGSRLCSTLLSGSFSRSSLCASLSFTSTRLEEDFHLRAVGHARHTYILAAPSGPGRCTARLRCYSVV